MPIRARPAEDGHSAGVVALHRARFVQWQPAGSVALAASGDASLLAAAREDGDIELYETATNHRFQASTARRQVDVAAAPSRRPAHCWPAGWSTPAASTAAAAAAAAAADPALPPLRPSLQRIPGHKDSCLTCVALVDEEEGKGGLTSRLLSGGLDGALLEWDVEQRRAGPAADSLGGAVWQLAPEPGACIKQGARRWGRGDLGDWEAQDAGAQLAAAGLCGGIPGG